MRENLSFLFFLSPFSSFFLFLFFPFYPPSFFFSFPICRVFFLGEFFFMSSSIFLRFSSSSFSIVLFCSISFVLFFLSLLSQLLIIVVPPSPLFITSHLPHVLAFSFMSCNLHLSIPFSFFSSSFSSRFSHLSPSHFFPVAFLLPSPTPFSPYIPPLRSLFPPPQSYIPPRFILSYFHQSETQGAVSS